MKQVYRSQLKNRYQRLTEILQEYEANLNQNLNLNQKCLSYSSDEGSESLAFHKFLNGFRNIETQQTVKLTRPKLLIEALTQALEFGAVKQSIQSHVEVQTVEYFMKEKRSYSKEIVGKIFEATKSRKAGRC